MMLSYSTLLAVLVTSAVAKTIVINVGQSGLTFSPDTTTAAVNDVLEFHFFGSFHTAVSGDFSSPCQMGSSGFDSGSINNKADGSGSVFQVTVKDTNPIWFFCGTPGHCQSGMAGVVNPPASGDSLSTYKSNAASASTQSGGTVQGGVVVPVPSNGASSSNPPPSSAPPSSSTAPSSSEAPSSSGTPSSTNAPSSSQSPSSPSSASSQTNSTTSSTAASQSSAPASPASPTLSPSGSSASTASTSQSSPPTVSTSGGAIAFGKFGIMDMLAVGLLVLAGFL